METVTKEQAIRLMNTYQAEVNKKEPRSDPECYYRYYVEMAMVLNPSFWVLKDTYLGTVTFHSNGYYALEKMTSKINEFESGVNLTYGSLMGRMQEVHDEMDRKSVINENDEIVFLVDISLKRASYWRLPVINIPVPAGRGEEFAILRRYESYDW